MNKKLLNRIFVSVIYAPLIVGLLYFGKEYFLGFIMIVVGLSLWELLNITKFPSLFLKIANVIIAMAGVYALYKNEFVFVILLAFILFALNSLILMLFYKDDFIKNLYLSIGGFIYPALSIGALVLIREFKISIVSSYNVGWLLGILLFLGIWICDMNAYFFGKAFGKTKIYPAVSPNKSWEGTIAGFLGSIIVYLIAYKFDIISFFTIWDYLAMAIITGVFGQLGDLVESKIKRTVKIKDSSKILMEHGGIFDRFDSVALSAPIFWLYLYLRFIN
ncbi:MAG: phosphatidate cytidylyltransferase [Candidatus Marinimicrobia bacterium]|nr:phosphatidate cytidylyltransferase [Candidatus Neomarinimicrobiota bacterium]